MPYKGVALLLRDDQRGKSAAPPFDLGNSIPLSGPCPDERWHVSAQCPPCDECGEDQRVDYSFHLEASVLLTLSSTSLSGGQLPLSITGLFTTIYDGHQLRWFISSPPRRAAASNITVL